MVIPPKDFTIPTPKPLTVADGDYSGVISGAIALALRLGTGVFAVGWAPFGSKSSGKFVHNTMLAIAKLLFWNWNW